MVDLYKALKLTGYFNRDDDLIFISWAKDGPDMRSKIMTVKQLKDRFDMRKEKCTLIAPYFIGGTYEGMFLLLKGERKYGNR